MVLHGVTCWCCSSRPSIFLTFSRRMIISNIPSQLSFSTSLLGVSAHHNKANLQSQQYYTFSVFVHVVPWHAFFWDGDAASSEHLQLTSASPSAHAVYFLASNWSPDCILSLRCSYQVQVFNSLFKVDVMWLKRLPRCLYFSPGELTRSPAVCPN